MTTQRFAHPQETEIAHTLSPVPLDLSELFDYFFLIKFHRDNISVQYTSILSPHTRDSQVIRIATSTRQLEQLSVMFGRSDHNVDTFSELCLHSVKHWNSHSVTTRVSLITSFRILRSFLYHFFLLFSCVPSIYLDLTVLRELKHLLRHQSFKLPIKNTPGHVQPKRTIVFLCSG